MDLLLLEAIVLSDFELVSLGHNEFILSQIVLIASDWRVDAGMYYEATKITFLSSCNRVILGVAIELSSAIENVMKY